MSQDIVQHLFSTPFLADFVLAPSLLPFTDKEVLDLDQELSQYEQLFLNPEVEEKIIVKRESGRATYYRFNFSAPEEETLERWLKLARGHLSYIPDSIRFV